MNIVASAWKTVENAPFPVTARITPASIDLAVAASPSANASHGVFCPHLAQLKISAHNGSLYPYEATAKHIPLEKFIHELLRITRTNFITLQTALCYVEVIAAKLPAVIQEEAEYMVLRASVDSNGEFFILLRCKITADDFVEDGSLVPPLPSPLLCSRRTFLASILLASKFLQDRSYSNKAWGMISNLTASEVGRCELALFASLDWRLSVEALTQKGIEGLDMVPLIPQTEEFEPGDVKTLPTLLSSDASKASIEGQDMFPPLVSNDTSEVVYATAEVPNRLMKLLRDACGLCTVKETVNAGQSKCADIWLPLPPSPTGTDLQSLSAVHVAQFDIVGGTSWS